MSVPPCIDAHGTPSLTKYWNQVERVPVKLLTGLDFQAMEGEVGISRFTESFPARERRVLWSRLHLLLPYFLSLLVLPFLFLYPHTYPSELKSLGSWLIPASRCARVLAVLSFPVLNVFLQIKKKAIFGLRKQLGSGWWICPGSRRSWRQEPGRGRSLSDVLKASLLNGGPCLLPCLCPRQAGSVGCVPGTLCSPSVEAVVRLLAVPPRLSHLTSHPALRRPPGGGGITL